MKLFSFLHRKKKYLSYTDQVIEATNSNDEPVFLTWKFIKKVVFVNVFEEYSGYFLTDEYKSKSLYDDISINCSHNVVRIRTGSSPTTNRNISKPFSRKFGLTSIYNVVFVEYYDDVGNLNLYAAHYDSEQKNELVADFKQYVKEEIIHFKKIIEGFTPLAQL